ncbi:MAG: zinc carboxypeptidase, partial [Bacteroidota bacterium]
QGRVHAFQNWRPNVLTDHHEMGTNATFFFMPGEPTRVYPTTPAINQELTARIGEYHARALDQIGSLYYSGEGYDDYYVGKGSTYPDAQGTVGILFEQASSRGHLQESENGLLSFPFTIRNQVVASLSTQAAFVDLREDLLKYQREVFDPTNRPKGGYLIQNEGDISRGHEMVNLLTQHRIEIQQVGNDNEPSAYYIDLDQPQHNLITALFETISEFEDSLFYDVSTWTLPYAFNLPTERLNSAPAGLSPLKENGTGDRANPGFSQYAYLLPWDDYYAAKATYSLMAEGLRLKVSSLPFTDSEGRQYEAGTILIPVANQGGRSAQEIRELIVEINFDHNAGIVATNSGDTDKGLMLGSRSAWRTMRMPSVAVLVDGGVSSYDAGEVWHLLDQRLHMDLSIIDVNQIGGLDLSAY